VAPVEPSASGKLSKPSGGEALQGLSIVATPIGNAGDITLRALKTLAAVETVLCEDTRITSKILAIHGIPASLVPYHDHNAAKTRPRLIERLKSGETMALVSDAGTPLVSDPGYKLVAECIDAGVPVTALPGASAVMAALMLAGLPTDSFLFHGFLPPRSAARRRALEALKAVPASLIFLESAKRLPASLADMAVVLGPRPAAVTRELTKFYEEARRGTLRELAEHYLEAGPPKGEVTLVIGPPGPEAEPSPEEIDTRLRDALETHSVREAAAAVSAATGLPRRQLYSRALELKPGKS